jgi:hypothetical protein
VTNLQVPEATKKLKNLSNTERMVVHNVLLAYSDGAKLMKGVLEMAGSKFSI